MITLVTKHGADDYDVWFAEIPENEPLWQELLEKYENTGCSVRGTLADVMTEIKENL